jgi:hypothetical protein
VLDRSHSMQAHAARWRSVNRLKEMAAKAQVDLYLTASPFRGEEPADPA